MTDDIDIYRSAKLLVDRHREEAPIHAAVRADELMDQCDMDGRAVWLRIKGGGRGDTAGQDGRGRALTGTNADLRTKLSTWASSKPTIQVLYVFGSYARGEARSGSDLDIAFEFLELVDEPLAELIDNATTWKAELSTLTGVGVKDIYLATDEVARSVRVIVFCRQ
jgi:predicted nucleotidyltransferase